MNKDIEHAANKMMLKITDAEIKEINDSLEELTKQFTTFESEIKDLKDVLPMTHTITIDDVTLRDDIPVESPDIDTLLKNATHRNDREIEVPKVVG